MSEQRKEVTVKLPRSTVKNLGHFLVNVVTIGDEHEGAILKLPGLTINLEITKPIVEFKGDE